MPPNCDGILGAWKSTANTNRIHRGLRINIFPPGKLTIQIVWERDLSQCSGILMDMLIKHDKELLLQTKTHINLEAKLTPGSEEGASMEGQMKLKESLERFTKGIMRKKAENFGETKLTLIRVYKWSHKGNRRSFRKKKNSGLNNMMLIHLNSSEPSDIGTGPGREKDLTNYRDIANTKERANRMNTHRNVNRAWDWSPPYNWGKCWTK